VQCTEHRRIAEVLLFLTFKRSDSGGANRSGAAEIGKLVFFLQYAASILRYLGICGRFNIYIIMKAFNGFLMIQKVYNVRKFHRPRLSDGFLTDSVDTTLAS